MLCCMNDWDEWMKQNKKLPLIFLISRFHIYIYIYLNIKKARQDFSTSQKVPFLLSRKSNSFSVTRYKKVNFLNN